MARFLASRGHEVTVSRRNAEVSSELAATHAIKVAENQQVVDATETVFLSLRPQIAAGIVEALRFRPEQRIVSVMAGISLGELGRLCAPATDIVSTIPLGFLERGGCPLAACPSAGVLAELFEPENPVVAVPDEAGLNAHFAICALVPGFLDMMDSAAGWLGQRTGDPGKAEFYTTELVSGFLAAMGRREGALSHARDALATEGTISLQMTAALRERGVHDALRDALDAIEARLGRG